MQGSFGKTPHEKNKSVCSICLESCNTIPVQRLPCGHVFHASCIAAWVNMCYRQQAWCTCPLCKGFFAIVSTATQPASYYTHQRRQGHQRKYKYKYKYKYQLVSFASPAVPLTWKTDALLQSKQGVFPEGEHNVYDDVYASDDSEEEYSVYEM